MVFVILGLAFVLVVGVFIALQRAGGVKFPWVQFYVRGKESGFTFQEIGLLRRVAIGNRLSNPTSLFWSVKTLDRCIRSAIISFRSSGTQDRSETVAFLIKLLDFRGRVEFDQPKYRLGLTSTRGIGASQTLKVTMEGSGAYVSKVIENNRKHLAITYPRGPELPPGSSWRSQEIKVYFWRQEDAGYFFESRVLGDFLDRKVPILHIAHSDNIVRAQKRRSVRREAGTPAQLFPLNAGSPSDESPAAGGYRCKLIDLSEDGAAVAIGGRAKAGVPVKLQATLGGEVIIVSGTVKSVNFKEKNRASILHIEATRPSDAMRIKILTWVYGLFSDGESPTAAQSLKARVADPRAASARSASARAVGRDTPPESSDADD